MIIVKVLLVFLFLAALFILGPDQGDNPKGGKRVRILWARDAASVGVIGLAAGCFYLFVELAVWLGGRYKMEVCGLIASAILGVALRDIYRKMKK